MEHLKELGLHTPRRGTIWKIHRRVQTPPQIHPQRQRNRHLRQRHCPPRHRDLQDVRPSRVRQPLQRRGPPARDPSAKLETTVHTTTKVRASYEDQPGCEDDDGSDRHGASCRRIGRRRITSHSHRLDVGDGWQHGNIDGHTGTDLGRRKVPEQRGERFS